MSILFGTGCRPEPGVTFEDVAAEAGITFRYTFGDTTYENIIESSGSGVTVFDYDGDGDMDLYLLNGTYLEGISDSDGVVNRNTRDQFYRNNGDGTFTDVSVESGLNDSLWSMAAGPFDYDKDGDLDIYLLNYGPNRFFRNNGNGSFTDVTSELGLAGPDTLNGFTKWSAGVTYWDYDTDGNTDLMVCNFLAFDPSIVSDAGPDVMPHPNQYRGQASMLYRHLADGTFQDVTRELGLHYPDSKCMGLTVYDYDDDGDLDLFQANDHQLNYLFRNDGPGKFTEVGTRVGVGGNDSGKPTGSMHGTLGDVDGDGLVDLLVVDLEYGALYRNKGNGVFEDITRSSGLAQFMEGKGAWGAELFDYDNDGDLDLFSANGSGEEYLLHLPLLLENDGKGHFSDTGVLRSSYFSTPRSGRGSAIWDFDNDGDQDIIVSHVDLKATTSLLRNDGGNANHWLGLTLIGDRGFGSAIGARVTVITENKRQVGINQWGTTYLSNNDPRIHFGLGKTNQVDRLEIKWPGGLVETIENVPADQYLVIVKGRGIRK